MTFLSLMTTLYNSSDSFTLFSLQSAFTTEFHALRKRLGLDVESPPTELNKLKAAVAELKKKVINAC